MSKAHVCIVSISVHLFCVLLLVSCAGKASHGNEPEASRAPAGTSDTGGGDWFVSPLRIKPIRFSKESELIEGVVYKRLDLHRCSEAEARRKYPDAEPVTYLPGHGFSAVKVQASFDRIVCSYGIVEREPDKALSILVNNNETNRDHFFENVIMHSKIYGGPSVVGNFLVTTETANKVQVFGNGLQTGFLMDQNFFRSPRDAAPELNSRSAETDAVFIASEIIPSQHIYFGNNPQGMWRLLLPLEINERRLQLPQLAAGVSDARRHKIVQDLDLLSTINLPRGFPRGSSEPWLVVAQIWTAVERYSEKPQLLDRFYQAYNIPLEAGTVRGYDSYKQIADQFEFKFSPTIGLNDISRAAYHATGKRVQFTLPLLNPTWRVAADMIHEITHALQSDSGSEKDEQKFLNEMEAHLNERAFLKGVARRSELAALAIGANNSIVAAGVPFVEFADPKHQSGSPTLCENVLRTYRIDRAKVSRDVLRRYDCAL
jgi:hypothetical protein